MARVLSNYARLAIGLVAGVLLVRALISLGPVPYGILLLLGVVTGLAASVQEFLTTGVVPVLAAAYHRRESAPGEYRAVCGAAKRTCWRFGALTLSVFLLLALIAPLARVPDELLTGVRWFLVARGVEWWFGVGLVPRRALGLVAEEASTLNGWIVAERIADVAAAFVVVSTVGVLQPGLAIGAYGVLGAVLTCLTALAASEPLRRNARSIQREMQETPPTRAMLLQAKERLRHSIQANAAVSIAMNFYLRAAMVIAYATTGAAGAYAFGLATQFSFYLRQVAMGLVTGIDGVAARVNRSYEQLEFSSFLRRVMTGQALVVTPSCLVIALFAEELLTTWGGPRLGDDRDALEQTALLVRLVLAGVVARSLSDSWISALTGVGYARAIAKPIIAGAVATPLVCYTTAVMAPPGDQLIAVAVSLSAMITLVHGLAIPIVSARRTGLDAADFFRPLLAPLSATGIAAAAVLALGLIVPQAPQFILVVAALVGVYMPLVSQVVLDSQRHRPLSDIPARRSAA